LDNFVKLLIAFVVIRFIYKLVSSRVTPKAGGEHPKGPDKKGNWLEEIVENFKEEFKEQLEPETRSTPKQKTSPQRKAPASKVNTDYIDFQKQTENYAKKEEDLKQQNEQTLVNEKQTTNDLDSIMENYTTEQKMIIFQSIMEKPSDSNRFQ